MADNYMKTVIFKGMASSTKMDHFTLPSYKTSCFTMCALFFFLCLAEYILYIEIMSTDTVFQKTKNKKIHTVIWKPLSSMPCL